MIKINKKVIFNLFFSITHLNLLQLSRSLDQKEENDAYTTSHLSSPKRLINPSKNRTLKDILRFLFRGIWMPRVCTI